jgi:cation diffusion facilitator family transporter
MRFERCQKCGERTALAGIWTNVVLVVLKITVGVTSGSSACIADGLHSASNIITAFAIIISHKIGSKARNSRFHYGYGKIEFVAAGAISLLITAGAVVLIIVSIDHLVREPKASPHFSAVLVAIISLGANEMLFRFMRCAGTQLKSQTIIANAWANRADCFSSLAVIIGVVGSRLGFHHLDPIAALFVVAVIIRVSIKILVDSVKALMDSSVNDVYGEQIRDIVGDVTDVRGIEELRTRHIGNKIWIDVDIYIDPHSTIGEGNSIAESVKAVLMRKIADLDRIMVNLKPAKTTESP